MLTLAATRLSQVAEITKFVLRPQFHTLDALHHIVLHTEGAATFRALTRSHPDLLHDDFPARVELRAGYNARILFESYDTLAALRIELDNLPLTVGYGTVGDAIPLGISLIAPRAHDGALLALAAPLSAQL